MRRAFFRSSIMIVAFSLTAFWCAGPLATVAESQPKPAGGPAKIRVAIAPPSLSYLPIYVAAKRGFFTKRGLDVELIQMTAPLTAAAVLNRSVDYTTIPSTIATAAARGAPAKVIYFASVKLQHLLVTRPEIATVSDLAGKRIGASGFGNLPAYQIQIVIDRYRLGPKTTIVAVPTSGDRLIAMQKGIIDAAIVSAPSDLKAEEMGLKTLLHMGTILQIPQAGLATTEEKLKNRRSEVIEVLKAVNEGADYTWTQRAGSVEIIGRWMALNPTQAAKAYDSVRDTFSRNGIPSDEQAKAYIAMLTATAGLGGETSAASIFDFSAAAEAAREPSVAR